jgi:hypothetical protein
MHSEKQTVVIEHCLSRTSLQFQPLIAIGQDRAAKANLRQRDVSTSSRCSLPIPTVKGHVQNSGRVRIQAHAGTCTPQPRCSCGAVKMTVKVLCPAAAQWSEIRGQSVVHFRGRYRAVLQPRDCAATSRYRAVLQLSEGDTVLCCNLAKP